MITDLLEPVMNNYKARCWNYDQGGYDSTAFRREDLHILIEQVIINDHFGSMMGIFNGNDHIIDARVPKMEQLTATWLKWSPIWMAPWNWDKLPAKYCYLGDLPKLKERAINITNTATVGAAIIMEHMALWEMGKLNKIPTDLTIYKVGE